MAGGRLPEIEVCRRAKNDGAPAPPSRHESTVLGENVHYDAQQRAEDADSEDEGWDGVDESWVDIGNSNGNGNGNGNSNGGTRTRRRVKVRPPVALHHPRDPSVPQLAHPASITDQLTQRNGYLSIRQTYLDKVGVHTPTNLTAVGATGGSVRSLLGSERAAVGSSSSSSTGNGSDVGNDGRASGAAGGADGDSRDSKSPMATTLLSSKDGPEWFNANVKQASLNTCFTMMPSFLRTYLRNQ